MPERAQVTSIEAIESFRANLLTYLETARPTVDEISSEVMRVRSWLEEDRLRYWEREVQRRHLEFREAEAALFSARTSHLREATHAEVAAVRKTKAALEESTERLRRVKRWRREFDHQIAPLVRHLDSLRTLFTLEMPRAAASLARTMDLLTDYSGQSPSASHLPSKPPENEAPSSSDETGGSL